MASVKPDQNIVVRIAKDFKDIDVSVPRLRKLVKAVCNRFARRQERPAGDRSMGDAPARRSLDAGYEISIAIVDDTQIRNVNSRFLNRKPATDCLSFDLSNAEEKSKTFELVVNGEMAVRQANLRGHSSEAELALYITHGLLHNLGFGDSTQSQARKMHDAEDEILQQLGYGLVYNRSVKPQEH